MFDKLFEVIERSATFGFALAFAGTLFIAGNKYGWWDVQLSPERTSFIIYATLLGYGMLVARFLIAVVRLSMSLIDLLVALLTRWHRNRNVMERLNELTPSHHAALYFISQNPGVVVNGSLYEEPFRSLCEKNFLTAVSQTHQRQGFRVNKLVYRQAGKIAAFLPPHALEPIANGRAPWRK